MRSTAATGLVYRRCVQTCSPWLVRPLVTRVATLAMALVLGAFAAANAGCSTVDPGANFVVPNETFDADFFYCRVEPEVLVAKRCGPGDPSVDPPNGCHFNSSAVSGMALVDHAPVPCTDGRPTDRSQIGAGSAAEGNLQAASIVMSRDVATAPIFVRPTGANHPRVIFTSDDPAAEILRQWAAR